ncbi:hypothetical protein K439DRAFT_1628919 [Ramaria rubella]|nr:hypothetical protein K439DRAFT_1628919 [Ramaria rubella]
MSSVINNQLPDDLVEDIILPDLLSQHLHSLLTDSKSPTWHAFYVLPVVSHLFHDTCQRLIPKIFGTKIRPDIRQGDDDSDDDDEPGPAEVLDYALSVCQRARRPGSQALRSFHDHNMATLMQRQDLVRVYTCLALGKIFLNVDILLPLGVACSETIQTSRNLWDEDFEDDYNTEQGASTVFDEANLHRCFMPFDCAQRICDLIVPDRLGFVVAQYMAEVLPIYHALPILAKHALDLRFTVARQYKFELVGALSYATDALHSHTPQDEDAQRTLQILDRLEVIEELLDMMMFSGAMVCSFRAGKGIPAKALKMTNLLGALDDVVKADWGPAETNLVRKKAAKLILRWAA